MTNGSLCVGPLRTHLWKALGCGGIFLCRTIESLGARAKIVGPAWQNKVERRNMFKPFLDGPGFLFPKAV